MKSILILMLISITIIQAGVVKEDTNKCESVLINGVYHDKEILKDNLDRPYLLAVDYSTNNLYFSYNINDEVSKTVKLNLNTKELKEINDINNGFAQTVDQDTHTVYIGGSDGIYKYNHNSDKAEHVAGISADIWMIYYKEALYYSVFPSQFLFTVVNGESVRFKDLEDTKVDHFVIDNEGEMFFTNSTGLYSQKKGAKDAILYTEFTDTFIRGLAADINGNVYCCTQDGIYAVDKVEISLDKLVDVDDAFGLAFDNDNNIVYSDGSSVIRLKANKDKSC